MSHTGCMIKVKSSFLPKTFLSAIFVVGTFLSAHAQNYSISGVITDADNKEELIGANILLLSLPDSVLVKGTVSDIDGSYRLTGVANDTYLLQVSYVGYHTYTEQISVENQNLKSIDFMMKPDTEMLDEIQVEAILPRMVLKGDTTEMNADAFKVNPDADASDLIKKMPGIVIQDGKIQAQGENVKRVLVDNKEFFGDDAVMTLKNLPADIISKIQVFDKADDQAEFSGFNDGETEKTINIVTRVELNDGLFGRVYAGYATDNRYQAGGNINYFKDTRRISLVGLSNNINVQNFNSEDLVGVASSTVNRPRGGMGGGGGGFSPRGGSVSDFLVTGKGGINLTNGIGLNYVEEWKKGLKLTGSYFFNRVKNENNSIIDRIYTAEDFRQEYHQNGLSSSYNNSHKLNAKLDYDIDDKKSVKITPRLTVQNNSSSSLVHALTTIIDGELLSKSENKNISTGSAYNFSNSILYRQKLNKPKRTFSVNFQTGLNNRLNDNYLTAESIYWENIDSLISQNQWTDGLAKSLSLNGKINYTEPLGESGSLQVNYSPSYTHSASDRYTYQYDEKTHSYTIVDYTLSNVFENTNWAHQAGLGYRYGNKDFNFNLGMDYRYTSLLSDRTFPEEINVNKYYNNILPSARLSYKFSRTSSINLFYRTNTRTPSITQLQDVIDNTNPLILSSGNKDLDQQYSHSVGLRWRYANPQKGNSAFAMISGNINTHYITNATVLAVKDTMIGDILLPKGGQYTRPVNVNGNWSLSTMLNFGTPLLFMKSNLNLMGGVMYNKIPNFINDKLHFNHNYNLTASAFIGSNISEKIDFSLSYRAGYNIVKYSGSESASNNYYIGNLNANITVLPWRGIVLGSDISFSHYSGLGEDYNKNFALWNAMAGYKFLKKDAATLSVQVFDILGINNSISREISETYIQDSRTDVLSRYFMVQFSYKFNKYNLGGGKEPISF